MSQRAGGRALAPGPCDTRGCSSPPSSRQAAPSRRRLPFSQRQPACSRINLADRAKPGAEQAPCDYLLKVL